MLPNCGKSFAQKTHLDIHNRAHSGEKPFVSRPFRLALGLGRLENEGMSMKEGEQRSEQYADQKTDLQGAVMRAAVLATG